MLDELARGRQEAGGAVTSVEMYQLMGQDSFEEAGAQTALANPSTRKSLRDRTLLIFPRTSAPAAVRVPHSLAHEVRVEVATGYVDPVEQLSSTRLRSALAAATAANAPTLPVAGIHEAVWRAAAERCLYAPLPCRSHRSRRTGCGCR